MASDFDSFGLELALEGLRRFQRGMKQYSKAVGSGEEANEDFADSAREATAANQTFQSQISDTSRQFRQLPRQVSESSREFRRWGQQMQETGGESDRMEQRITSLGEGLTRGLRRAFPAIAKLKDNIANFFATGNVALVRLTFAVAGFTAAVAAAAAAVAGLTAGIAVLGKRGAEINGTLRQFRANTERAQLSSRGFLNELRKSAQGTVSDVKLLTLANKTLTESGDRVAEVMGRRLPDLLAVARKQAAFTGSRVDKTFSKLRDGIQNTSAETIRQQGILIDAQTAYREYAQEVGRTTQQLSKQDKQIALLQATIDRANKSLSDNATEQRNVSLQLQRAQATAQNTVNTLAVALRPALGDLLAFINRTLQNTSQWVNQNSEAIRFLAQGFIDGLIPALKTVGGAIADFVQGLAQFGKTLVKNGSQLIGALARGFVVGANKFLFPVIQQIAQFVADFLTGSSPAKRGPLSEIDSGAAALMQAWADGISSVNLKPVDKVASQVNNMLGNIANLGMNQVEKRLLQLDKALLPFQNRVRALRAEFEAFNQPAQRVLETIEKQIDKAQQAVARGAEGSGERLRRLRNEQEALQKRVDTRREELQNARMQLNLQKAQQAEERSLLQIRQRQLELMNQGVSAQAARSQALEETGGATGGALDPSGLSPGFELPGGMQGGGGQAFKMPEGGDIQFFERQTQALESSQNFAQGIADNLNVGTAQAQAFEDNLNEIETDFRRIKNIDFIQDVLGVPDDLQTWLNENMVQPLSDTASGIRWIITGEGEPPDVSAPTSIANLFDNIRSEGLGYAFGQIASQVGIWVRQNIVNPLKPGIEEAIEWFESTEMGGSLANLFERIRSEGFGEVAGNIAAQVGTWAQQNIVNPLKPKIEEARDQFEDPSGEGTLANLFQRIHDRGFVFIAGDIANDVRSWVGTNINDPLINEISGLTDGMREDFMSDVKEKGFGSAVGSIAEKVRSWADTNISTPFFNVVADALDWIIGEENSEQLAGFFRGIRENGLQSVIGSVSTQVSTWVQNNLEQAFLDFSAWLTNFEKPFLFSFSTLPSNIETAIGNLAGFLRRNIFNPFFNWVRGDTEGQKGLPGHLQDLRDEFGKVPRMLFKALKGLGGVLWEVITTPLEAVLNEALRQLENFFGTVGNRVNAAVVGVNKTLNVNLPTFPTGELGRVTLSRPDALTPTFPGGGGDGGSDDSARRGGIFGPGRLRVHQGEMILQSASAVGVLNRDFIHAMSEFTAMINGTTSMMQMPAASQNPVDNRRISNDNSMTLNMQGRSADPIELLNRLSRLRTFGDF